jgi:hypothetical protein
MRNFKILTFILFVLKELSVTLHASTSSVPYSKNVFLIE